MLLISRRGIKSIRQTDREGRKEAREEGRGQLFPPQDGNLQSLHVVHITITEYRIFLKVTQYKHVKPTAAGVEIRSRRR